jgi:PleD family two-component response regulator
MPQHKHTILICDDDADVRVWLRARIRSLGYAHMEVTNGEDCLETARIEHPDLIILDINMLGIDGFEVCTQLRKNPQSRHIPVIMLTAVHTHVDDRVRGLRLGADDYLPKDVDPDELAARIDTVLRRAVSGGDVNSLTKLPGNTMISDEIDTRILSRDPFAVTWLDLDNFKAFNDRYGFARGDKMLVEAANALREALQKYGDEADFLGHVAGDDFVIVSGIQRAYSVAESAVRYIDERFPLLYDLDDRTRGHMRSIDRHGKPQTFPIATVSVAIVHSQAHRFLNVLQVAEAASDMQKVAKTHVGSKIVVDRRVH